jgi:hypothetical protein
MNHDVKITGKLGKEPVLQTKWLSHDLFISKPGNTIVDFYSD